MVRSRVHPLRALSALAALGLAACGTVSAAVVTPAGPAPGSGPRSAERASSATDFRIPPPDLAAARPLRLWATYYSVPVVHAVGPGGVALLDRDGKALGPRVSPRDLCDGAMQGSLRVLDAGGAATTYDFVGLAPGPAVDCTRWYPRFGAIGRSRFRASPSALGVGAHGVPVPFRTIAVDQRHIPKGSVVYVPAARGVTVVLPSGARVAHDGYFYAGDSGGGVRGNHIDVFLGLAKTNPFPFARGSARATFPAYLLEDRALEDALASLHGSPTIRAGR